MEMAKWPDRGRCARSAGCTQGIFWTLLLLIEDCIPYERKRVELTSPNPASYHSVILVAAHGKRIRQTCPLRPRDGHEFVRNWRGGFRRMTSIFCFWKQVLQAR